MNELSKSNHMQKTSPKEEAIFPMSMSLDNTKRLSPPEHIKKCPIDKLRNAYQLGKTRSLRNIISPCHIQYGFAKSS